MSYLLLIVEKPGDRSGRPPGEGEQRMSRMVEWGKTLTARGVLAGSNSLLADDRATRVQMREGKTRLIDGPFAEAREMIGGYFLLDVATREEALEIAKQCPAAAWATVELREIGPCFEA